MDGLVEVLGWAASIVIVAAFWRRADRHMLWALLAGLLLMAVHQVGVGAHTAAAGFAIGALRTVAVLHWPRSMALMLLFCGATAVSAALTWSGLVSALAAAAGIATTVALFVLTGRGLRLALLPGNGAWITHHLLTGSMPSLAMEVAIMAGNLVVARHGHRQLVTGRDARREATVIP